MSAHTMEHADLDPDTRAFYCRALTTLCESTIPFLIGGGHALQHYTGIVRRTKDLDIFVRPADVARVLDMFSVAGYQTELTFPAWLGKVLWATDNIDVICSSGNGIARVDEAWFAHAATGNILGMPLKICPAEEIIWSKATIMGRERYDGADIAHLLHAHGSRLDWPRLLDRFGPHWRVLLSHLILFGYIYPTKRSQIPGWVIRALMSAVQRELSGPPPTARVCQGTVLSWDQYLSDLDREGYHDGRLVSYGALTPEDIVHLTAVLRGERHVEPRPPSGPCTQTAPRRRQNG